MPPRGACSCEWTKKAVTVEKADAVEKAEDAAEKVAVADNPQARVILCTRMAIPTSLSDLRQEFFSTQICWIKSLVARTMAFASGSNALSRNSDSICFVGDSTYFVNTFNENESVNGIFFACALFFASFPLVDSSRLSKRVATCLLGLEVS